MSKSYTLTVAVLTYHPDLEKMKRTIRSILLQEDVDFEIVVADDGSPENHFEELGSFFEKNGIRDHFTDYKLLPQEENTGTVKNIAKALAHADGKYVKFISPGDFLNEKDCLKKWMDFIESTKARLTFSNLVAYEEQNGKPVVHSVPLKPQITEPYDVIDIEKQKEWILWMNDLCCGATFLGETAVYKKYIDLFVDRVTYAEDFCLRLAIADNILVVHYPENAVWYECNSGISTGANETWAKRINDDFIACNDILLENEEMLKNLPSPQKYAWTFQNFGRMEEKKYKICKLLKDPLKVQHVLRMRNEPRNSATNVNTTFLNTIW